MRKRLLPANQSDCRLSAECAHAQVPGKQRPPRLDCSQYDSPVIANGDGTQSNWLGLHGWQVAPRNTGRQQVGGVKLANSCLDSQA